MKQPTFAEFVALMALMIALVAFSTDAMLPALPEIGRDLGVKGANDSQLVISWLFIGMAIGQLFYGPISDTFGRKPTIYAGLLLFMIGCILAMTATSYPIMLLGRLIQGLGVASPRSVSVAIVRDKFVGRMMARVMSFIMAVFILVPIIAPAIGQGVLLIAGWRSIFGLFLVLAVIVFVWFMLRLPESLPAEQRIPFSAERIIAAFREVLSSRAALGFTIASGLISGAFLGYLNSAQPVFQDLYGLGTRFPLIFAAISIANGVASVANATLVLRYGMRRLTFAANTSLAVLSVLYLAYAFLFGGQPALWTLIAYFLANFFAMGIMFGNMNSLAMEPLGHIAGVGAAVVGSLATFISIPLGTLVGQGFDGTILPLIGGFAVLCSINIIIMRWANSTRV